MSQEMKITTEPDKKMSKKAKKPSWYKNSLKNRWNGFFVKKLSSEVTEEKLWNHFSTCGIVTEVKIVKTKKHGNLATPDCALIKFASTKMAVEAMRELNGKVLLQKKLQISWQRKEYLKSLLKSQLEKKKTKLEMKDSEKIHKLKGKIEKLKQEKLKISEENKELKNCNKSLKKENSKLCDVIKDLVTQS